MKRLLKAIWRHKIRTLLLMIVSGFILLFGTVSIAILAQEHLQAEQKAQLAAQENACTLNPQTFLNTVNQWRVSNHVRPLQYSPLLQQAAQVRIADMQTYHYYGHDNPVTKEESYTFVFKIDPNIGLSSEVLDGSNSITQAVTDFRTSPQHFAALTSPKLNYIGVIGEYLPESWAVYDNSGNLQAKAGIYHSNCIVIGELADRLTSPPMSTLSPNNVTSPQQMGAELWSLQAQGVAP